MTDPYKVLEVSPQASDDEIKRAYRVLSRKYHPDANVGNPDRKQAEEHFKEIQQAYQAIVNERERKTSYGGNGVFTDFSEFADNYGRESDSDEYQMHLRAAANYIKNGYFPEAVNVLNQMDEQTACWYYLSAVANAGLGNNILALEHAKMAVLLEPSNLQYRSLVAQLEAGSNWYQEMQSPYSMNSMGVGNCCMNLCCIGVTCELLYSASYCINAGYLYNPCRI